LYVLPEGEGLAPGFLMLKIAFIDHSELLARETVI
jgi:hypothetical protein